MFKNRMPGYSAPKTQTSQTSSDVNEGVADMAHAWEESIPGARDFVRQMNRAKAEFFKGVAALINGEIQQAEQMDAMLGEPAKDKKPQKIKVE